MAPLLPFSFAIGDPDFHGNSGLPVEREMPVYLLHLLQNTLDIKVYFKAMVGFTL